MRNLLFIFLFLIPLLIFGQTTEVIKDSFPTYQGTISFENKSTQNIYNQTKKVLVLNEIKSDAPEQIISTGIYNYSYSQTVSKRTVNIGGVISYNLIIDIKDNKLRYTLDILDVKAGLVSMTAILKTKPNDIVSVPVLNEVTKFKNELIEKLSLKSTKQDNW